MLFKINKEYLYDKSYLIYYIIYFLSLFGVTIIAPKYLDYFTGFIKIYIALILIYRFNPFSGKIKCDDHDKKLIFNCAIFLLLTTTIGNLLINLRQYIYKKFLNF